MNDAASDRAFKLFVDAYAAAWAPEQADDPQPTEITDASVVREPARNEAELRQRLDWRW